MDIVYYTVNDMAMDNLNTVSERTLRKRVVRIIERIDECLDSARKFRQQGEEDTAIFWAQYAHCLAYSLQELLPEIFGKPGVPNKEWGSIFGTTVPVGGVLVGTEPLFGQRAEEANPTVQGPKATAR